MTLILGRWEIRLLLILGACLCQGCTYMSLLQHTYSGQAVKPQVFHFQDGAQAQYFSFDKRLQTRPAAAENAAVVTYMFVVNGSDCTSMAYFLPQYFRGLEGESGPIRVFILQKRFIEARTWGRYAGCSEDFIRADHPQRWIADQAEFITAQLAAADGQTRPKRIALLGISEGGDIVPVLASRIKGVTHAAIVANGGMNPIDAYRLQAKKHGFANALQALGDLQQPNPDPQVRINGRSWLYWSELQALPHTATLLALPIPILMGMGEADQSVPIESAWYLRDQFASHGKSGLTLLTYPGADHGLQSTEGSFLPDFFHKLDLWLGNNE